MNMKNKKDNLPEVKNTDIVELRSDRMQQFVTFYFGEHFFGLSIDDVIEINRALETTPVPLAPPYVFGVVNLRGQILTAIHLAKRIKLESTQENIDEEKKFHNVITGNKEEPVCLLVERIGDVMSVPVSHIEKAPDMLKGVDTNFVKNVCKLKSKLLIILESAALESAEAVHKGTGEEGLVAA